MTIKFIGFGGVFDYECGNSSAILSIGGQTVLIDAGYTVYPILCDSGLIESIDYILLTHLHGDHVGSLFPIIHHLNNRAVTKRKVKLLCATASFEALIRDYLTFSLVVPDNYIDFIRLDSIPGCGFLDTTDKHVNGIMSYAYYFVEDGQLLYYSGDLGDVSVTQTFLDERKEADILVFQEMSFKAGKLHVFYRDAMRALGQYKVFGYHNDPKDSPPDNTIPLVGNTPEYLL